MSKWIWLLALVALAACKEESGTGAPTQPEAGTAAAGEPRAENPAAVEERKEAAAAAAAHREKCVDTWLLAHDLNEYGDPPDTMYTGGTPLFDERTGERKGRVEHVMTKHPSLRDICR